MTADLLFYVAAGSAIGASLVVVLGKNPVYSIVALVASFFSLAVLYLLLEAYFLAVLEVFVYAGAIMVLFLFVVMLLNVGKESGPPMRKRKPLIAVLLAAAFALVLGSAAWTVQGTAYPAPFLGDVRAVGRGLFTVYLFPFEAASLLLLVALIGAVYLAKKTLR